MTARFLDKKTIAELTARMYLDVGAVRFMEDKPFIFTSGWASPVYTDCRRLISFPRVRRTLIDFGAATIMRDAGFEQFDARRSELDALSSALDSLQARTLADSLRTAEPVADLSARRA